MPVRSPLPVSAAFAASVAAALATPLLAQASNEPAAGYVLSVRGQWRIGAEAAASGRTLSAGDTVRAGQAPWRGHEIVLVLRSGDATRYRCVENPAARPAPEAWDCSRPIAIPRSASSSLSARMLDAVMNHFGKHASRPASLVSRGILDRDLREAVATYRDGRLDLTDALSPMPAGDYSLTLLPIEVDGAVVRRKGEAVHVRLSWDPRAPVPLAVPGLSTGLHELGMDGSSDVAWLLVCASSGCDAIRSEFAAVRELTAQWAGQVSSSDVRAFVRAALDLLRQRTAGS
jgi:hypothetical protein